MPLDLVVVGPLQNRLAGELGPIVTDYAGRFSIDPDESVQLSRDPSPRDACVGDQAEVFTAAIVVDLSLVFEQCCRFARGLIL